MTKQILVVDDEEDICESLRDELLEQGYVAEYVTTGEKAIEQIDSKQWDMILVDIKLSTKITGLNVIEAMHVKQPHAIIVAMSGYEDIAIRQKVGHLGAIAFLRKPEDIRLDVFDEKIKTLLQDQK